MRLPSAVFETAASAIPPLRLHSDYTYDEVALSTIRGIVRWMLILISSYTTKLRNRLT
jgi:hypothetical protein